MTLIERRAPAVKTCTILIVEDAAGGVHINAIGLPHCTHACWAELSPAEQLAATLMAAAEKATGASRR